MVKGHGNHIRLLATFLLNIYKKTYKYYNINVKERLSAGVTGWRRGAKSFDRRRLLFHFSFDFISFTKPLCCGVF